jgi:Fic family protein
MKINEFLQKINQLRSELNWYLPLENEVERNLWDKIRLDWNYHSSNIEGIDLSFEETQQLMLKRGEIQGKKVKDCNQVKGHDDAIAEIKNHIKEQRPFTEHFIRELHQILLKEEYYNQAITLDGKSTTKLVSLGAYKLMPNDVMTKDGLFRFALPEEVGYLMQELVKWYNKEIAKNKKHPILIATEFHYKFIRIHPFDDGNGRMARLITNYILMYFNYPPIIIESKDKENYINALRKADKGVLIELKKFFAEKLLVSLNRYLDVAKGKSVLQPGDLKKRILVLTKKVENQYMRNSKSQKYMVETLSKVYAPLVIETNKHIQDVKHLFVDSSWNYFEEPKDGMIPTMPMTWGLQSILRHFLDQAQTEDSFHHFKIMNWLTTFRSRDKKVDVEIAFKIFFSDFDYEIKAYVGQPMESSVLFGSIKKLFEAISEYNDFEFVDDRFSGFEYTVHKSEYGTIIPTSDIINWAEILGHKFVGYIEKKAGLNPHKEEKPRRKFLS